MEGFKKYLWMFYMVAIVKRKRMMSEMFKMEISKMCLRKRKSKSLFREMKIRFKVFDLYEL